VTGSIITAVADEPSAWKRLQVGCHAFLGACTKPAVRRILLSDAPSVLGWEEFREIDNRHGLGLLKVGLRSAMDEGAIEPAPVDSLAHLLVGALNEAAMVVGRARDTKKAGREAAIGIDRLLAGIAAPSAG
jgi:hypothetical protein